jgi:plasmid stabilization system protein ParE
MNYRISRKADTDIGHICDKIAEDNPDTADRVDLQIHRAIQLLARFPGLGHTRPDVKDKRCSEGQNRPVRIAVPSCECWPEFKASVVPLFS